MYSVLNLHFFLSLCTGEAPELHYTLPVQSGVLIQAHGFDVFVHRAGRTSPAVKESYTCTCAMYTHYDTWLHTCLCLSATASAARASSAFFRAWLRAVSNSKTRSF